MIRLIVIMNREQDLSRITAELDSHAELRIVGIGTDRYGALKLAESEQPDVAVIDYYLDNGCGLDIIHVVKRKSPGTGVIVVSPYDDMGHARDAMIMGASGYLLRKADMDILVSTVYMVHTGGYFVSHRIVNQVFRSLRKFHNWESSRKTLSLRRASQEPPDYSSLSRTEWQILEFLGQGKSTKEIAEILNLKIGTVRNCISLLMHKTGIHNRSYLADSILNSIRPKTGKTPPPPVPPPAHRPGSHERLRPLLEASLIWES
ncbi:MAG: response regulator transcription factor [Treponema sp.]|nr:response regulator transcription factor [Treponema sp.]